jgi:hypothetical protein
MREDARETIEQLNDNDTWLFEHMIIAFWHGFGIGNGLSIKKEDVEKIHYKEGPCGYRVKKEVMQAKLQEYIRWLESYKKTWGTNRHSCDEQVRGGIYEPYYKSSEAITRMIELLQV